MKTLSEYERGWIEALIDGEGSISLNKIRVSDYVGGYRYRPCVVISNTNRAIIAYAHSLTGGVIEEVRARTSNQKSSQRLCIGTPILRHLLPQLQLLAKERQRLLVLEACSHIYLPGRGITKSEIDRAQLEDLYQQLKRLNRRGL